MIGCMILGGLMTFAALKLFRHRRRWGGGCWHHRRWHGHHGHFDDPRFGGGGYPGDDDGGRGYPGGGERLPFYLRYLGRRLYTTPTQEQTVADAVTQFRADVAPLRAEAEKTRADLASALRRPSFDEVLFGELFARHDDAIEKLRKAVVGLGARVHDTLDERQREQLASMIEKGRGFRGRDGFGWGF